MEEINIIDFLNSLKKKWYYLLITAVLAVIGMIIYTNHIKVPTYQTYTTLVLTQSQSENTSTITQNDLQINQKLVYTYSELIKSKRVLNQVIDNLGLKYTSKELTKYINVSSVENTEILKIIVTHPDAKVAADISNEIAKVFSREVVNIYDINNVSIIDEANVPKEVSNNTLTRDIVLSFALGLLLSTGVIFIIYYFDDTIKFNDNLEEEVKMPIIGKILKLKYDKKIVEKNDKTELIVNKYPKSLVSEGIKSLRTNLSFSSVDSELKTLLITSSVPGEGKSFVSSNLATAFAQAGKKVLLIDCDMRKGRLHKIFSISNEKGLSNLLVESNFEKVYNSYIKSSKVKKLYVLPCGTIPPNPSELLNSGKNKKLIEFLSTKYDLIIFDGVPCNGIPDSLIMSTLVDKTLIVSSEGVTPKELLNNTKKSLDNVNANIAGVIINKVNTSGSRYYGKYYSYYGEKE